MPRLARSVMVLVSLIALALTTTASTASGSHPERGGSGHAFVLGEILVGFQPGANALDRANAKAQLNAMKLRQFRSGVEHWRLAPGQSVEQAIQRMKGNPKVRYAEPNYILSTSVIPNDPRLNEMYGLINTGQTGGTADADIDAEMAWGVSIGSNSVVVGVIDTGCDYNHPDLAANVWTNPGEIAGNSIDDDNNGFVDDVHGWDFYNNDADPFDDNGHGTHTSGTIGAVGNNGVGVVGVNWDVKIMCLKFLSGGGSGSTAGAIAAVDYSVMMGVDLTSNSWGGGGFSQALYDSIADAGAADMAFVAASGNNGANTDTSPHYPSAYDLANIISVAATDHNDALASFSNYGLVSVDLGAPGVNILSTLPGNSYGTLSGTSMATPHVAGVAALVKAVAPNIPVTQLKSAIMTHTDPKASLAGRCVTGGRLNGFFAIATPDTDPPSAVSDLATTNPGSNTMGLTWTAPGEDGSDNTGTASFYEVRYSTAPIDANSFSIAIRAGNEPNPDAPGTPQSMEVRGLVASTYYYFAIKAFDEWGNAGPISNIATDSTLPPPTVGWAPTSISEDLLTGETADHIVTLANTGVGTLDFTIPTPSVGEPFSAPQDPLILGKDEPDPRQGDPVVLGAGGPDAFGYRWIDSDESGGPVFAWTDISGTGTPIAVTGDDATSAPIPLSFSFPFYGTFFTSLRACTNGFVSLTDSSTAYQNQPLPNSGAPANLIAPFWDDLNPGTTQRIYFQDFGNRAIVQWQAMPPYSGTGAFTFQAILEQSGVVTYQYLSMTGAVNSATVGIQDVSKTTGLQVAFNQAYIHDGLAVRISAIPQWLTVAPTSGRLGPGESVLLNVHIDAAGLEGGHYPGLIDIQNNDPATPSALVDVLLHVVGAPDIAVQPAALAYGTVFQGLPNVLNLTVANTGTDTLVVSGIGSSAPGELVAVPSSFGVAPHGSQNVIVTWTPSALGPFTGALSVENNSAGHPTVLVPVTGDAVAPPVVVTDPTSFEETLYSNQTLTLPLVVTNSGGSNLILTAAADQGQGGNGLVVSEPGALGSGGPDAFGYRWRDSDASGGPTFAWEDISTTGTLISLTGDDVSSAMIPMGMTFPLYGNSFTSFRVCTNGFITFTTGTTCPFSNGTLFSTTLPADSVAMFWDDLVFRTAGGTTPRTSRAYWKNDGTKVIIQYKNVYRIGNSTTDDLNFEVFLYPSGKIVVQYETMASATLNSETIGIQGTASPNFLQVIANVSYMHNNLAIQISRVPDWLTVTPSVATVPPGGSQIFNVKFDSTSRTGGTLTGSIRFGTNIPAQPVVNVPATLHVIGVPTAAVVPSSFSYGTVYTGYPHLTSFQVVNNGTDVLNVTNVDTTDPILQVEEPPGSGGQPLAAFPLPPGGSRLFALRWSPVAPGGPLNANVRIHSDDPVNPILLMPITGNAIEPPIAVWTPPSFTENMMVGDVVNETLHVSNEGNSDLTFSTTVRALGNTPPPVYGELKLDKDEIDPRPGILGSGGPDLFGYRWRDSDDPAGPTFAWTDISGIGTPITTLTGDDQISGALPIGFTFPFYGTSFSTLRVNTNGWLSFTSTIGGGTAAFSNQALPTGGTTSPENLLAAFWDDLDFRSAQHAYYYNDGTRFIVQWNHVDHHSSVGSADLTFQVILHPNGRIVLQYLTMTGLTNSATIGFQNSTRNDGQTVVFNAAYVHNNLAIQISPPLDFLQVSPSSGTIPAHGGPVDLNVRIDATNLIGGDYAASLDLITNDPANGLISVPVMIHVTGIPDIDVVPTSLTFPTTFVGFGSNLPLAIRNVGTDVLTISGTSSSGDFAVSGVTTPVTIPAGGQIPVTVTFAPTGAGLRAGSLIISSDDPDEALVTVPFSGIGLFPPEIDVDPAAISTALPPGGSRTKTLSIHNDGGSDLTWAAGTNLISVLGAPVTIYPFADVPKGGEDPRPGILGSGGPDLFGYRWIDSDEPGGPVFNWVDISGVGTPIVFDPNGYCDDCNSGPIAMGLSVPYYGTNFNQIRVNTNGWLSFTSTVSSGTGAYTNQPLPNSGSLVPENLLAGFWDDLVHRVMTGSVPRASHVYYYNDGTRFIVQFQHMYRIGNTTTDDLNFQVILYPSGKIVYQYLSMVSGTLNLATIGQQNATKSDGLTIVYNAAYVHDGLAIQIQAGPEWMMVSPTGGTIPAGGSAEIEVLLNAMGLSDGIHEAAINITSNDPYTPLVTVPVTLNVGLVQPTYVDFDPDVLNLGSSMNTVKVTVELPAGLDPRMIDPCSVLLNDTVPVVGCPGTPPPSAVTYSDQWPAGGNGIEEVSFRFDRTEVGAVVGMGESVPLYIQGEVTDIQWWRGSTTIRTMHPHVTQPQGGSWYLAGWTVPVRWEPSASTGASHYIVLLSRDGANTWEEIASGVTGTAFDWVADAGVSASARIRVVAVDNAGRVVGYDENDGEFTLAGATLRPPRPVDPSTLHVDHDPSGTYLEWKWPDADLAFGPATGFRILVSDRPNGGFVEQALVSANAYTDTSVDPPVGGCVFFSVLATNPAGDAP